MARKSSRVSEMASFLNRPAPRLNVIQYPSGKWGFCGKVPMELAYEGSEEDLEIGRRHGFGLVKGRVKSLSWPTREDALETARIKGHAVANA